jgi:hypothetical protein
MLNLEFQPFVAQRNYPPTRTFVTKWDVEIDRNRAKKIARRRDRDTKYFDDFDHHSDSLPPMPIMCEFETSYDCEELESDDGEGEEFRQTWLRSVYAENAYYERKYPTLEIDNEPVSRKRFVHFDEHSLFKRGRL